jgi:HPt (histidine-containing phosphotransfer) domain-containing protein
MAAGMNDHVGKPFDRYELYALIDRWLPDVMIVDMHKRVEAPSVSRSSYDDQVYRELAVLLGPDKIARLLDKLAAQLEHDFFAQDWAREERSELARRAHSFVSQAGMLGFLELSEVCRDIETACLSGGTIESLMERSKSIRDQALADIARLKSEMPNAA